MTAPSGADIPEDRMDEEYWANAWVLGNRIIKLIMNPAAGNARIYHQFYCEKDESSIFGEGLPRNIRDTQITIAAAGRRGGGAGPMGGRIRDVFAERMDDDLDVKGAFDTLVSTVTECGKGGISAADAVSLVAALRDADQVLRVIF